MIRFEVPGDPVAFQTKNTRFNRGGKLVGGQRKTKNAMAWQNAVAFAASEAWGGRELIEGPVQVLTTCIFARPKGEYRKRTPRPREWCTKKKADLDKVLRLVHDALTGVVYVDDCQVASIATQSFVGAQGEPARTIVSVRELQPVNGGGA